jgi:hypothetical protein
MLMLQGQQFEQLRDALLAAFSPTAFDEMLLFQLSRRRTDMSGALPGSPCFTIDWEPIAMHQRGLDSVGEGVKLDAVLGQLEMSRWDLPGGSEAGYSDYSP